ncbi:MAG: HAD family hydrolase [Erysipelotrichales bacterium]|nr:MAG: HAD family hydrolase [Erysipelotrichales bacterium]
MKVEATMTDIKLIIFDIDGTLIKVGQDRIEDSAVQAIREVKAKGIKVLVATGRTLYFVNPHVREVVDCDYFVTVNGHCLMDKDGNILMREDLPVDAVQRLHDFCVERGIAIGMKCSDAIYVTTGFKQYYDVYAEGKDVSRIILDDSQNADHFKTVEAPMGIFLVGDQQVVRENAHLFPEFTFSPVKSDCYDVYGHDVNKTKIIEEVLRRLKIRWEQVMAFGDGENDTDMLRKAGYGVAMGNAKSNVRKFADFVTKDVDEGGIAFALKHYKIL